jgi:glycosyltransferase involved in cell wall biosynthesis
MRIAHVTDCYLPRLGGIEMQVHDLAVRQRLAGHDVEVITATQPDDGAADPAWVRRVRSAVGNPAVRAVIAASKAPQTLSARRPFDVVHVHASIWSPLSTVTAIAATRHGIPTVLTVHSLWSGLGPLPRVADTTMRLRTWPMAWSAVSEVAAVPLRQMLGPDVPVSVLPNGIDPEAWRVNPTPRDNDDVTVASVMRLAARKRPLQLLRMLREVRDQVSADIGIRAVIIGEGPERRTLQRYVARHGMAGWVSLPGRLERGDIRTVFAQSDLYVAPARLESFGIAALEARCAGLPVVATARGGVGEFVTHGREGLLAGDDGDMVRELAALIGSRSLRAAITRHNRTVPSPLSWAETQNRADQLYDEAMALAGGRPRSRAGGRAQTRTKAEVAA